MENYFDMHMTPQEIGAISSLGLAHIGDGVFELLVRSWLCGHGRTTAQHLHRQTVAMVCAPAQSRFMELLEPKLTEQELALYRRGRNAHVHSIPKQASPKEYARATGLECLFGGLYLAGQTQRINELFTSAMEEQYGI